MNTQQTEMELTAVVKARVPKKLKRLIAEMARSRMLSTSDIVREALARFIKGREAA